MRISFAKPLDPELFDGHAQNAARGVARRDDGQPKSENNPTQLRRFYDEIILWETRVAQQPDRFEDFLPFIRMLNAKAAYAQGRKLVDQSFVDLLRHTLAEVKDPDSMSTCKRFWEGFMGYYKLERPN